MRLWGRALWRRWQRGRWFGVRLWGRLPTIAVLLWSMAAAVTFVRALRLRMGLQHCRLWLRLLTIAALLRGMAAAVTFESTLRLRMRLRHCRSWLRLLTVATLLWSMAAAITFVRAVLCWH